MVSQHLIFFIPSIIVILFSTDAMQNVTKSEQIEEIWRTGRRKGRDFARQFLFNTFGIQQPEPYGDEITTYSDVEAGTECNLTVLNKTKAR